MKITINEVRFAYLACGVWFNMDKLMETLVIDNNGDMVKVNDKEWLDFIVGGYYEFHD